MAVEYKMITRIKSFALYITLFVSSCLMAQEPFLEIDANRAYYKNSTLFLEGDLLFDHELGHIEAGSASFVPMQKSPFFSFMRFSDLVRFSLWDGSKLECFRADFDQEALLAIFTREKKGKRVFYQGFLTDSKEPIFFKELPN